jgi:putative membrane protein
MKVMQLTAVSAIALGLAACGKPADTAASNSAVAAETGNMAAAEPGNAMAAAPAATGGQAFVNAAAASDAFEIGSSRLALTKASSAAVKRYAQQMIDAHLASTAKLKTAAAGASPAITPDPTLNAEQASMMATLSTQEGEAFDNAYRIAQVTAHEKTLATLKAYGTSGDVPGLKAFATETTPVVAAHLNMAAGLK